jgi:hypothetical protein
MKKLKFFALIILTTLIGSLGLASQGYKTQRLYCIGGVDYKKYNLSRPLNEMNGYPVPTWLNESEFDDQNFIFKVEALENSYHYQIILKDQNLILVDEVAKGLPQLQSAPLNKDESIFIHCREMTALDFCRYHTC